MNVPASVSDYQKLAKRRLPRHLYDLVEGGSYEELTLAYNRADLRALRLRQRVMRDVSKIETGVTVLGQELKIPVILAPIGLGGLVAKRAEVQAARAAEQAGVRFCLSTVSICSMEEVQRATNSPFWFQLYMMRDRGFIAEMLQRAQVAGCDALVFTVDLAVLGMRYRDVRHGLASRASAGSRMAAAWEMIRHLRWLRDVPIGGRPLVFGNLNTVVPEAHNITAFKQWVDSQFDPGVTWRDIAWVREHWKGPIIVKGILTPEDAREAAAVGAEAIVVSNHGGRQLDSAPSTISVLPKIVDAIGDRVEVLMDGGVRSGQDLVKAIALGARACLIGRAWVYAAAARGERGVSEVLEIMRRELEISLTLLGVPNVSQLDRSVFETSQS